ncbi:MAG: hypothetical protein HYZ89_01290 [Candidatus Omnitrophica bacterium]|nr:hypothetical protein [Candidatus Omnitrophota bacterium]
MNSQLLTSGREVAGKLIQLAAEAETWSLCSTRANALQGQGEIWGALEPHLGKLQYAIIGLEFHLSEPWILRALHDRGVLRVVISSDGTFHPNVYIFRSHLSYAAIVGSACFDMATLENSCASAILTKCDRDSSFAYALEAFLDRCRASSRLLTPQEIDWYERQTQECAPLLERLRQVNLRRPEPLPEEEDGASSQPDFPEPRPAEDHFEKDAYANGEAPATRQTEIDTDAAMYAFRQAARGIGQMEEPELLRLVARHLGYQRLGRAIEQLLKKHLRTAIRRGIIVRSEELLFADSRRIGDYSRDEVWQVLCSVMRVGRWYDRKEVPALVAKHLGFSRVTDQVRTTVRSAITTAIRRGVLVSGTAGWICRSRS